MYKTTAILFAGMFFTMYAHGASLLRAQTFPKTENDLSFADTTAMLTAGYAPFDATFDATGRCISGCAYGGLNLEQELAMIQRAGEQANADLVAAGYSPVDFFSSTTTSEPENTGAITIQFPNTDPEPQAPLLSETILETIVTQISDHLIANGGGIIQPATQQCTPNQPNIPANQRVPFGAPLVGQIRITSAFGPRVHPVTGQSNVHYAVDLAAAVDTDVFATASGTVKAVTNDATCGRGIRIQHEMGFETHFCHLNTQLVAVGERVSAGCRIAKSGRTGNSTGPHLHYGILRNGKPIDPTGYLNHKK